MPKIRMKAILAIAVVLGIAALAWAWGFPNLHFVREDGGGGTVLWNADEAYLFMYECPAGFIMSVPEYLAEPIREYFHAPAVPMDQKCTLTVLHVNSSGVDRHSQVFDASLDFFTPINGSLYANCAGGICKWDGATFKLIPRAEERAMGGYDRLSKQEFSNVDGWFIRWIRGTFVGQAPSAFQFSVQVDGSTRLLISGSNPVSVVAQGTNGTKETIWYHKQRTHLVSVRMYKHTFAAN